MLEPNFFFCKNGDKKSIFIVKIPLIAPTLGGGAVPTPMHTVPQA